MTGPHNWQQPRPAGGPTPLPVAQRAALLDQAVAARVPYVVVVGGGVRASGPVVKRLSPTEATVTWQTPKTHPAQVLLDAMFAALTCGFWLPFWFAGCLRRPGVYRLEVDWYGNLSESRTGVSAAQRVLSAAVGAVLLWWLLVFLPGAAHVFHEVATTQRP